MNCYQHRPVLVVDLVLVVIDLIQLAAPDAALSIDEVIFCVQKLALEHIRNDRRGDYLSVRVRE